MMSHLLLFSGVALSVLFGSMVQNTNGIPSNYDDWLGGMEIPDVTLIMRDQDNKTFSDGYVESSLEDDNVWWWDFYKEADLDPSSRRPKHGAAPTIQFGVDEINNDRMGRNDNTVNFSVLDSGTERDGSYSFIFTDEADAKNFTGEEFEYSTHSDLTEASLEA